MRLERGTGNEGSISDSASDSDSELMDGTELTFSTPAKEQRKKRERKFGDMSGISGLKAQHDISSEGEPSGGTNKEVKKPRLAESMGTEFFIYPRTEEYEEDKDEVSETNDEEEVPLGDRGPNSDKGGGGSPERDH